MSNTPLILSIDQGTTSSRAIVFNLTGDIIAVAQEEFPQIFPQEGWVEHNPEDIWETTLRVSREAVATAENKGGRVECIGITNQRETTIVWDRATGKPVHNAIVWQDRRTADHCTRLAADGAEAELTRKTGLLLDPYFSASKIAWILDHAEGARARAKAGDLAFGTVDTFLIWRLTGGKSHMTDATNASRTSLYNIHDDQWDDGLLSLFDVPKEVLPEVRDCTAEYGVTDPAWFGREIPITGVAGDQQAATIGQCCFQPGDIKSTYGTGCFVLMNTGDQAVTSKNRLLTTIGYKTGGRITYAVEGSIFMAGATVQWLRDSLGIITNASETEALAKSIPSTGGVYLVPAFAGLGAPHWSPDARGAFFGLSRASGRAEMARAALEAVCYQTSDLLQALKADGITPASLRIDGGMVANDWLVQFLADVTNIEVERPVVMETTALGAAYLAGLQAGLYGSLEEIAKMWRREGHFRPRMDETARASMLADWDRAVQSALAFSG